MKLSDYHYQLPTSRIAQEPLPQRDMAKLLFYDRGTIKDFVFHQIPDLLPDDSFLFFNNTKVIPARLLLQKPTGAVIEIFLLEPKAPSQIVAVTMEARNSCTWTCLIGNRKRFKEALILDLVIGTEQTQLKVELIGEQEVVFVWNNENLSFAEILHHLGKIPLPPYIKRSTQKEDEERYQTIFAKKEGAVAAPTASLHFTENVLKKINLKGIKTDFLTLHVGAGTFQPVKEEDFTKHTMHSEKIIVSLENIENLLNNLSKNIIAVGTTAMRTLESLYWFGAKILQQKPAETRIVVEKLLPYQLKNPPLIQEALEAIRDLMLKNNMREIGGETEIFIFPSYEFKICKGLITNFHLPQTTLILLVAAFVGEEWRKIYEHALKNEYRFLSYGDTSLLLPNT
ncbi:MAG: S-adenosylmethionine:tRNA ribosyltransferase-isomerase [Raineya sp.]